MATGPLPLSLLQNLFDANGDPQNFRIVEVPGCGDCLFQSLSHALTGGLAIANRLRSLSESHVTQEAVDVKSTTATDAPMRWGDGDDIGRLERALDIKCILLSTTEQDDRFQDGMPRVLTTPFGDSDADGVSGDTRYVIFAYDEGLHFRPILFVDRGVFRIGELPWLVRSIVARAVPPFRDRMLRAAGCIPVLS
jgi:hypothetical protein